MNSRDVVGLYEAYRSVYEEQQSLTEVNADLEEGFIDTLADRVKSDGSRMRSPGKNAFFKAWELERTEPGSKRQKKQTRRADHLEKVASSGYNFAQKNQHKEEVDIYDLVLDHLLDEGFCDDVESAEVIMANMSEEWLDEILDEAVEIMSVTSPTGERRKGSRVYSGRASLNRQNARKLGELQKRQALNPRAQGSRSARRQSEAEFESNAKKSVTRLNAKPNTGDPSSDHQYHLGPEDKTSYYPEVPTDYRARKRRASGR